MWQFLFYYFEFTFTDWYESYWIEILALASTKFEKVKKLTNSFELKVLVVNYNLSHGRSGSCGKKHREKEGKRRDQERALMTWSSIILMRWGTINMLES